MSEKERQIFFEKVKKICVATISLIVLIISLWIIFDCFKVSSDREELILNYSTSGSVDYKVYLKENKFYDKKYLSKDKKYISNIIDYVDVDVSCLFSSSKELQTSYTYNVTAKIVSDYEVNGKTSELWSKDYVIKADQKKDILKSSTYKVNENIKIDYSKYDALAKKFKEEYGVMADTKLTVTVNINSTSKAQGTANDINVSKSLGITMPLNKTVTDITELGTGTDNNNVTQKIKGERHINYVLLIIGICLSAIFGPVCAITFYKLFKITNVSQYMVQQRRILKGYSDIIAEVTTKPDLRDLKIVEVKEFEDLINIEEELRIPILFYELEKEDEAWFIITTETQAYRYILKSSSHLHN